MSLSQRVLSFVDAARRAPALASSPEWLSTLEAEAFDSLDGAFFALNAPVAPLTWEVRGTLLGAAQASPRIPFDFPHPVEIVGFRSTVVPLQPPIAGTVDPSALTGDGRDVVDVLLDIDKSEVITFGEGAQAGQATTAGPNVGQFVTLAALDVQAPRILDLRMRAARPQIGFTFQWTLGVITPNFSDCLIKVAMFVRDITNDISVNVPSQLERRAR